MKYMLARLRRYNLLLAAFILLMAPVASAAGTAALQPFTPQSLETIKRQHRGQPFLLVLWSVTCAPCYAELAMLSEMLQEQPELPVVLVSTDAESESREVRLTLEDYGLNHLPSWQFSGNFHEQLRYTVDPGWYGELPRSYFHDSAHNKLGHSGALKRGQVEHWWKNPQAYLSAP